MILYVALIFVCSGCACSFAFDLFVCSFGCVLFLGGGGGGGGK